MAAMIVGNHAPPAIDVTVEKDKPEADDDSEGLKAIAEDIMHAIKSGDAHTLAMALHDFVETCSSYERDDEDSEEAPAPEENEQK